MESLDGQTSFTVEKREPSLFGEYNYRVLGPNQECCFEGRANMGFWPSNRQFDLEAKTYGESLVLEASEGSWNCGIKRKLTVKTQGGQQTLGVIKKPINLFAMRFVAEDVTGNNIFKAKEVSLCNFKERKYEIFSQDILVAKVSHILNNYNLKVIKPQNAINTSILLSTIFYLEDYWTSRLFRSLIFVILNVFFWSIYLFFIFSS